IPALSKALDDSKQQVREAAAGALDKMGAEGLQALSKALTNAYPDVKEVAIASLGKAGSAGVTPLADVIKDLRETVETRRKAVEAVKGLGKDAKSAVPALVSAIRAPKAKGGDANPLRVDAIKALPMVAEKGDKDAL